MILLLAVCWFGSWLVDSVSKEHKRRRTKEPTDRSIQIQQQRKPNRTAHAMPSNKDIPTPYLVTFLVNNLTQSFRHRTDLVPHPHVRVRFAVNGNPCSWTRLADGRQAHGAVGEDELDVCEALLDGGRGLGDLVQGFVKDLAIGVLLVKQDEGEEMLLCWGDDGAVHG